MMPDEIVLRGAAAGPFPASGRVVLNPLRVGD